MTVDPQKQTFASPEKTIPLENSPHSFLALALLAALTTGLYGVISFLSWRFDYRTLETERPIILVLLLFAGAFVLYLFAIHVASRAEQIRGLLRLIVWSSLGFRIVLLFSVPIQEIDIYRYLWDGAVTTAGVSPFRYSPEQVRTASAVSSANEELQKLVLLRDRLPALAEILWRIHYGELPTIYPPTSQAVFAAATLTMPSAASVMVRVFLLKAWFVAFDFATLLIVIRLLTLCRKPSGLCIIHGWCPLLMKEVANSGHLDAIAVFLTTLAIYVTARLVFERDAAPGRKIGKSARAAMMSVVLGLAVGAKLYPIILAPLLFLVTAKAIGSRKMLAPVLVFVFTVLLVLWPMLPREQGVAMNSREPVPTEAPPQPASADAHPSDPSLGVKTFLRRWEMNDFLFMLLIENLKPLNDFRSNAAAWFSVLPQPLRLSIADSVETWFKVGRHEIPFLAARALTSGVFLLIAIWLIGRAMRTADVGSLCEASFLTLAWFWLLCPTQNPWYWTWALPMLPFARSRAWLALSGVVLMYYLRFWFSYHWPETPVWGTNYVGYAFFDFVVTWIEFAPWFAWLAVDALLRKRGESPLSHPST